MPGRHGRLQSKIPLSAILVGPVASRKEKRPSEWNLEINDLLRGGGV
jgi:hypothetical protein